MPLTRARLAFSSAFSLALLAGLAVGCTDQTLDPYVDAPPPGASLFDQPAEAAPKSPPLVTGAHGVPDEPPGAHTRLFVAGGDDGHAASTTVWSAQLLPDGTLGEWRTDASLAEAREGLTLVSAKDMLLAVGGTDTKGIAARDVLGSYEDGASQLSTWAGVRTLPALSNAGVATNGVNLWLLGGEHDLDGVTKLSNKGLRMAMPLGVPVAAVDTPPLTTPRSRLAAVHVGGFVLAIGGDTDTGSTSDVLVSYAGASAWHPAGARLPEARIDLAATAIGDEVFVVGGRASDVDAPSPTIYGAFIDSAGTIGRWNTLRELPKSLSGACVTSYGAEVYVIGGVANAPTADVYRARVDDEGKLGVWEHIARLPEPRAAAGCVVR